MYVGSLAVRITYVTSFPINAHVCATTWQLKRALAANGITKTLIFTTKVSFNTIMSQYMMAISTVYIVRILVGLPE